MHCQVDSINEPALVPIELLLFPDTVTLPPGYNLVLTNTASASGKKEAVTFKWTEST